MLRAISTALIGLGMALASSFAGALSLSHHAQVIGFVIGACLIALGAFMGLVSVVGSRPVRGPRIALAGEPSRITVSKPADRTWRGGNAEIVIVPLQNTRDSGGERASARQVVATVKVIGVVPTFTRPVSHGRWGAKFGHDNPLLPGAPHVDFPPTREVHYLGVVGRWLDGETTCHLIDTDLAQAMTFGPEVPRGISILDVELRGQGLRRVRRLSFELDNGTNPLHGMKLREISRWKRWRERKAKPGVLPAEPVVLALDA